MSDEKDGRPVSVAEEAKEEDALTTTAAEASEKKCGKRKLSPSSEPISIVRPEGDDAAQSSPGPSNANLPSWVAGASPAKFIAPDEVLKMSMKMDNLALVHEIAIDKNYRISEEPANPIEKAIKDSVHRAFFDLLREDLQKEPPVYEHAFNMLMEIKKTMLDDLITDRMGRFRAEIDSTLDESRMRSQLEQGQLPVLVIARIILHMLSRLCSPARDEQLQRLKGETDLVELIRGTFDLMDKMKVDLNNFVLSEQREQVEAYSAKLEWEEFAKELDTNSEAAKETREWLSKAYGEVCPTRRPTEGPSAKREASSVEDDVVKSTSRGYVRLVESARPSLFPETMRLDRHRLEAISEKVLQLDICASSVLVACHLSGRAVAEAEGFKKTLKDRLVLITNDIDQGNLRDKLCALAEECVKECREKTGQVEGEEWTEQKEKDIRAQIADLINHDHAVRKVVHQRVTQFIEEMLSTPNEVPRRLLPGLSTVQAEICGLTARLLHMCAHNRRTFNTLYLEIVEQCRKEKE